MFSAVFSINKFIKNINLINAIQNNLVNMHQHRSNLVIFSTSFIKKRLLRDISCNFLMIVLISIVSLCLTLFGMGIFGTAHGWWEGVAKRPSSLKSYLKRSKKYMNQVTHPLTSADSRFFFHWKSANFVISRSTYIDCILVHNF